MEPNTELKVSPTEPTRDVAQAVAPTTQFPIISQGVPPKESGIIKEEWPQAVAPSEAVRRSHHKKKIPIKVQPICLDTIYDPSYVPSTPVPLVSDDWVDDWEAPLENKPSTLKRKPGVLKEPGTKTLQMKKASKKPKLGSEEHEQKPPIPILHLHLQPPRAIKPRVKHPDRKELGC